MRILGLIAATSALLAACGDRKDEPTPATANESAAPVNETAAPANETASPAAEAQVAEAGDNGAAPAAPAAPSTAGPCLVQDGKPVTVAALRATGTEPFWGARVEGRCVTYSNPENQAGTRLWTRFAPGPGGGTWSGSLDGKRFELRIRTKAGCSDGMSDKSYPLEAELLVGGERHSGCAEPA